jgi:glycosyltransferase involved in cell wall biosynthesis
MNRRGWNIIHYGRPGSTPLCTHVDIPFENNDQANQLAGEEIAKRKQPGDIIVCIYGYGNMGATQLNSDLKVVEPVIGYPVTSVFAPYRVFTSYAHMHMYCGHNNLLMNPPWFDAVIPNGFEISDFEYCEQKENYLLYFGRVIAAKGVELCIHLAEQTGNKLLIAGPGTLEDIGIKQVPPHVEMLGLCDANQRRILMSRAKALLGPTFYIEPFGNMVVEALFSGTPVITTDWGGFTETNIHGVTGYRCRDWYDFLNAVRQIDTIRPDVCRAVAEAKYTNDIVHDQHHKYMQKIVRLDYYSAHD